jgi:3-phosphoshikimate 1-carboxyvinyltransferase
MSGAREILPKEAVQGVFHVPGSKSLTNRALICAALANGESRIQNPSDSSDSGLMANGLDQMGVLTRREGGDWVVQGTGGKLFAPRYPVPVGNAGTTLRFFLALAALAEGTTIFDAAARMAERPNEELFSALREAGVRISQDGTTYRVDGGGINGGRIRVDQSRSSQFLSAILLVAPYARAGVAIDVEGAKSSESYVRMTLSVMADFGVHPEVDAQGGKYRIGAPQRYRPTVTRIEADASGGSYGLAAAAIAGGDVLIEGMRLDSLQGDAGFPLILHAMGCDVRQEPAGVRLQCDGRLSGVTVDMNGMPDVVPTLASVALFASGPSIIRNVAQLHYKESDRLEAIGSELRKLGAEITIRPDGLEIVPAPLSGALLDTYDDHRLAMSFALIGLRVPGVKIENPDCVAKSFPRYWEELDRISS